MLMNVEFFSRYAVQRQKCEVAGNESGILRNPRVFLFYRLNGPETLWYTLPLKIIVDLSHTVGQENGKIWRTQKET